jgi:hypothetical protein
MGSNSQKMRPQFDKTDAARPSSQRVAVHRIFVRRCSYGRLCSIRKYLLHTAAPKLAISSSARVAAPMLLVAYKRHRRRAMVSPIPSTACISPPPPLRSSHCRLRVRLWLPRTSSPTTTLARAFSQASRTRPFPTLRLVLCTFPNTVCMLAALIAFM